MGVATDGQICFGIVFEDGYRFPWENDEYEGDIEEWWLYEILDYKDPVKLYDENGEYLDGHTPTEEERELYYNTKEKFLEQHPVPVKLVNYSSHEYSAYIIAIPKTCNSCSRGYPKEFTPNNLIVSEDEIKNLIWFCEKYCKPENKYYEFPKVNPKWYLSSYWG